MSTDTPSETRLKQLLTRLRALRLLRPPRNCELPIGLVGILDWVARSPGCGVLELADGLAVTPPTVSVGVRRLIREGWLETRRDPNDRRAKPLFITPKSETQLSRLRTHQKQVMRTGIIPEKTVKKIFKCQLGIEVALLLSAGQRKNRIDQHQLRFKAPLTKKEHLLRWIF